MLSMPDFKLARICNDSARFAANKAWLVAQRPTSFALAREKVLLSQHLR